MTPLTSKLGGICVLLYSESDWPSPVEAMKEKRGGCWRRDGIRTVLGRRDLLSKLPFFICIWPQEEYPNKYSQKGYSWNSKPCIHFQNFNLGICDMVQWPESLVPKYRSWNSHRLVMWTKMGFNLCQLQFLIWKIGAMKD